MGLDEQRILAGVSEWNRSEALEEQPEVRTRTQASSYIHQAQQALAMAARAMKYRRKEQKQGSLAKALRRAQEAADRAYEISVQSGETREVGEGLEEAVGEGAPANQIKKGTKLRLERVPIYGSSGTGKGKQSTKTVASVEWSSDHRSLLLRFKEVRLPGHKVLDSFRGIVKNGELIKVHGDRANYEVVGIVK